MDLLALQAYLCATGCRQRARNKGAVRDAPFPRFFPLRDERCFLLVCAADQLQHYRGSTFPRTCLLSPATCNVRPACSPPPHLPTCACSTCSRTHATTMTPAPRTTHTTSPARMQPRIFCTPAVRVTRHMRFLAPAHPHPRCARAAPRWFTIPDVTYAHVLPDGACRIRQQPR